MNKHLLAVLLAGVSTSAFAADLPTSKGPPAPPSAVYAPIFTWTGVYAGLNAGVGITSLDNSNFAAPTGGVFGGQVGFNYQAGQLVLGAEGDLEGAWLNRSGTYALGTNKFETGMMTTERLRAGVALDRTLLYVTGGYAGIDTRGRFNDTVDGFSGSQTIWRDGGAIGVGGEYAFTNNLTAKVEYLYMPFTNATYFAGTPSAETSGLSINLIRLGVNYKF